MSTEWVKAAVCPVCGGQLEVQVFYCYSFNYAVTKKGRMSKRYTRGVDGPMDCTCVACLDCYTQWDASKCSIEQDGTVFLKENR